MTDTLPSKDETLIAWLEDCQRHIESGVATDLVAVCPVALSKVCRELIQRRVAAGLTAHETPREPAVDVQKLNEGICEAEGHVFPKIPVKRCIRCHAEFEVHYLNIRFPEKANEEPAGDKPCMSCGLSSYAHRNGRLGHYWRPGPCPTCKGTRKIDTPWMKDNACPECTDYR